MLHWYNSACGCFQLCEHTLNKQSWPSRLEYKDEHARRTRAGDAPLSLARILQPISRPGTVPGHVFIEIRDPRGVGNEVASEGIPDRTSKHVRM